MIDDIVEQVGEENAVQIVTDNTAAYKAAGEMLMEKRKKLFWTHCAAHCIDLMLEDLEKKIEVHELTIMNGRKITTFIYSRTLIITIMKHFTKDKDLIRPAVTCFATAYMTLGCLFDNRNALRTMFASKQWKAAYPLIKVLRMMDSDEKPVMGFIYSEMEKVKQKIKTNFKDDLKRSLHAAAYYLNLHVHFSSEFRVDREVMRGLYKVMDRMLDDEERDNVDLQLEEFKHERGLFGFSYAKSEIQENTGRLLKDKKIRKQVDLQVEDISSVDEWIVENETENTATLSHNFNLRSLGRGNDGDEESGGIQIGDEHAENMHTQEHGMIDDLKLLEEDEFDILYDDDEDLDEI
ncbi:uncharacterized protein LOC116209111 [Punica granatum]|uniref:Uncharacterized protein LOC116209111 n=1 Tax=Punica granatum TaxID=22663 RepID=A0A6P8DVT0_PUNGR|nr:uncharacterized protein LOC116209111 [Punica granatum]